MDYSDCTGAVSIIDGNETPVSIDRNIFTNNVAYHGAGFYSRGSYNLIISNNIFSGNTAYQGAALALYHNTGNTLNRPLIVNSTFFGNTATTAGGAIRFNGELNTPVILNCIFWENEAPTGKDIRNESGLELVVSYSDVDPIGISGMWTGTANFHADPEFITGDTLCHLGLTSPCKNAGTASLEVDGTTYYAPLVDFDGETRPDPQSNLFDVGADEYWGLPDPPVALDPDTIGPDFFVARWESTTLAMGYYLDVAFDAGFSNIVTGYDNLDVGSNLTFLVEDLESVDYYYRVKAYNAMYVSENSNVIAVLTVGIPTPPEIGQNGKLNCYPNPFSSEVTISFNLEERSTIALQVFNNMGQAVAALADETREAGPQRIIWDASGLPAGMYYFRLTAGHHNFSGKAIRNH
jgi:predicted outer membrane repeat protein